MPKVLEQPSKNSIILNLPKRPPANPPAKEQSFEHALKRAQPKREQPVRNETQPKARPADDAPAQADEQGVDAPVDAVKAKSPDLTVEQESPDAQAESDHSSHETEAGADESAPAVESDAALAASVVAAASEESTAQVGNESVTEPSDAAVVVKPAVHEQQVDSGDVGQTLTRVGEAQNTTDMADEADPDDPLLSTAKPVTTAAVKPSASANERPVTGGVQPESPTEAMAPIDAGESESSETEDDGAKSQSPRVRLAQADSESADDPPQPVPAAAEATATKEAASPSATARMIDAPAPKAPVDAKPAMPAPPAPVPVRADAEFVTANHDRIVSSVRSQLLPNGGSMHLRLDPPELGALQIHVRMIDGVMQASFQTSSDQATRLLSHTLSHLKTALESKGVSVEKLQVQQSPRDQQAQSNSGEQQQRQSQHEDSQAQREQQRRELMNRMWRRIRLGRDPLDMVA